MMWASYASEEEADWVRECLFPEDTRLWRSVCAENSITVMG